MSCLSVSFITSESILYGKTLYVGFTKYMHSIKCGAFTEFTNLPLLIEVSVVMMSIFECTA